MTFLDESIEAAVSRARRAAGEGDVVVIGADVTRQALRAGVVDELGVGVVPLLLGRGVSLFDGLDLGRVELERTRVVETAADTDIRFRVKGRPGASDGEVD